MVSPPSLLLLAPPPAHTPLLPALLCSHAPTARRLHFLVNNLSVETVDSKVREIKDRIWPDYVSWFASYMVVKRAAQEANYHVLYISLIDK